MRDRKSYERRLSVFSSWTLKAIGLVIAGAIMVLVARNITKAVSVKSDSPRDGKFVGVRHEAGTILATSSGSDQGRESSSTTVVRNGVTVVSPRLLVPVVDMASMQTAATGSEDDAALSINSNSPNRPGYVNRSHSRRQTRVADLRWTAYGSVLR
jgi:hypothetical protein